MSMPLTRATCRRWRPWQTDRRGDGKRARLYAQTMNEAEVKTTLLRELSHRVKNNLTAVVGLLSLGLENESMPRDEILTETLTRVQSMAVAHSLLANSPRARVDVAELGRQVLAESIRRMSLPGRQPPFQVHGEVVEISGQQAASLALVLNELVANGLKHGGGQTVTGLSLCVERHAGLVRLEFSNPLTTLGEGEPGWTDVGIGQRLIRTLVEKDLGGHITFSTRADSFFASSALLRKPDLLPETHTIYIRHNALYNNERGTSCRRSVVHRRWGVAASPRYARDRRRAGNVESSMSCPKWSAKPKDGRGRAGADRDGAAPVCREPAASVTFA